MATMGTGSEAIEPADLASILQDADVARIESRADADGLAAAAILGTALAAQAIPRHLTLSPSQDLNGSHTDNPDEEITVGVPELEQSGQTESLALCAYETAEALGTEPDAGMALAGAMNAQVPLEGEAITDANTPELTDRPGLAIPTADVSEGLAYSGWLHLPVSGDVDATETFLDELEARPIQDDTARKRLASAIALELTERPPRDGSMAALQSALGTHTSPTAFETVGGYADVLHAAAMRDVGNGLAALLGDVNEDGLLDLWRSYGKAVHEAVAELSTKEEEVVTGTVTKAVPADVARLGHDFRVQADRLYVAGQSSIALAVSSGSAVTMLTDDFPDEPVTGAPKLATVRTDAGIEAISEMSGVTS